MTTQRKKRGRSQESAYDKLAISMPHGIAERARQEVQALGAPSLSAYIVDAVEEKMEKRRFRKILDDIFSEEPMTGEERDWADSILNR